MTIDDSSLFKELKKRNSEFIPLIIETSKKAESYLSNINILFSNYTLHDIGHSIRVMDYIYEIVGDFSNISDLEITIIICTSLLHDIGMFSSKDEIENIKDIIDKDLILSFSNLIKKFKNKEEVARYYIRNKHAIRSKEIINSNFKNIFTLPDQPATSFSEDVANICQSHCENTKWICENLAIYREKGIYTYNPQYIALLLRVGDILDFDSQRTPPQLYCLLNPKGFSKEEWQKHFQIDNRLKIKNANTSLKKVEFHGECNDMKIHRKILEYFDYMNQELFNSIMISKSFDDKYQILLEYPISNKITSKEFDVSNLKITLDFNTITDLIMGETIYTDAKYGLRELIQNSIDACMHKSLIYNNSKNIEDDEYSPKVKIVLKKRENQVIIKDNGTGMNYEIIKSNFLNIGKSYYKSNDFLLSKYNFNAIGRFGIGFLSCFMLSSEVSVRTRHFSDERMYTLNFEKGNQFLGVKEETNINFNGTEIILNYSEFMSCFSNNNEELEKFIEKTFLTDSIPIEVITSDNRIVINNKLNILEGLNIINLSKYLKEITGYIKICDSPVCIDSFEALIPLVSSTFNKKDILSYYLYENNKLRIIDKNISIDHLIHTEKIMWVDFPILTSEELKKYKLVLENDDSYTSRFNKVKIFFKLDDLNFFINEGGMVEQGGYSQIKGNLIDSEYFKQIIELKEISGLYFPKLIHIQYIEVFNSNSIALHFTEYSEYHYEHDHYNSNKDNEIYYNGISLTKQSFNSLKKPSGVGISCSKINIKNSLLSPSINRLSLDNKSADIFQTAIEIVILLNTYENIDNLNFKKCLKEYIKDNYDSNKLIKNEILNKICNI